MRWLRFTLPVSCVVLCFAQDQPAGSLACPTPFQVDGLTLPNSATVFLGNGVESGDSLCTFRNSAGATVELAPHSGMAIAPSGVLLTHGALRLLGQMDLTIPSVRADFRPAPQSVLEAKFGNGEFVVDVSRGAAQLSSNFTFAQLDSGTRMRFLPAPDQPAGLDLLLSGCARLQKGQDLFHDLHIRRPVELIGNSTNKQGQRIEVRGALQPIDPASTQLAARVQVLSEKVISGACDQPYLFPVFLGLGGAATVISATRPGQESTPVSVP